VRAIRRLLELSACRPPKYSPIACTPEADSQDRQLLAERCIDGFGDVKSSGLPCPGESTRRS